MGFTSLTCRPFPSAQHIDLRALLLSVHKFFDALGGEEIRRRGARKDKPLLMVKTVLHEVRGGRIRGQPASYSMFYLCACACAHD